MVIFGGFSEGKRSKEACLFKTTIANFSASSVCQFPSLEAEDSFYLTLKFSPTPTQICVTGKMAEHRLDIAKRVWLPPLTSLGGL